MIRCRQTPPSTLPDPPYSTPQRVSEAFVHFGTIGQRKIAHGHQDASPFVNLRTIVGFPLGSRKNRYEVVGG